MVNLLFLSPPATAFLLDGAGWAGSALVVLAYALNMAGRWAATSPRYYLCNIVGSLGLIANTWYHHAIPSAVVNVIWVALAGAAWARRGRAASTTRAGD